MDDVLSAAESGDLGRLGSLLRQNPSRVTDRSSTGDTPLHFAAWQGHVDCVALLLDSGADPNVQGDRGWTPLHYACHHEQREVAQLLLGRGAFPDVEDDDGYTPLQIATQRGLGILFESGDVDAISSIAQAVRDADARKIRASRLDSLDPRTSKRLTEQLEISLQFLDGALIDRLLGDGDADLIERRFAVLKALLAVGANPDGDPTSQLKPVHIAAQLPDPQALELLLRHGADLWATTREGGRTVLSFLEDNEAQEAFASAIPDLKK